MSTLSSGLSSTLAVEALLAIEEEDALEAALAAAEPGIAARAVNAAPTLEQKTSLLWAMEDRQRRAALDQVPPALVGALVQNLEEDNRYLLGDLSLEQFRALLQLCSPERKYYWITTALSFTDARANALPLLLTTQELVEILLTRVEFEEHLRALGDYPVEDLRLAPDLLADPAQALVDLMGPEALLRQFPVADPGLEQVLQTLLDYDPDRYVDLIRAGLRAADYQENHPLEWETLTEEPVLLDTLPRVELFSGATAAEEALVADGVPLALLPVTAGPLALLVHALPPARRQQVADEMQYLYIRQAVAEGGSFHRADLERVARSVEAYLLLGLQAESGGNASREADVLAARPLHKISESGARLVESLRQVALRLRPLEAVLDPDQRAVVRSLAQPRLTVARDGTPRVVLLPGARLPAEVDFPTAALLLQEVAGWSTMARAMGLERTEQALRALGSLETLQEELAVGAVVYGRVEPGLTEPEDRARFAKGYLQRGGRLLPTARGGLRRAVDAWARGRDVDPVQAFTLLDRALDRLMADS